MNLSVLELAGSAQGMGEEFGERCREEIGELYRRRVKGAIRFARLHGRRVTEEQILGVAEQCLEPTEAFDPVGYEEFLGIARGAGLSPAQCYAMQGLTDLRDVVAFGPHPDDEGCTSFVVGPDRSATGHLLLGQTWDLATDNMPFVRLVHRRPEGHPQTWSLTLTGCLTLIGINEAGIAVGNTNLHTRDARVGTQYLTVLHRALRARSLSEAAESIRKAPRAGAHYYYVGSPENRAVGMECSAAQSSEVEVREGAFVHCNHALSAEIADLEVMPPGPSTLHRQERLGYLMETHAGTIGVEDLKSMLSDHDGGDSVSICRHDFKHVSTNATVIMSPATREIHACRGQPHVGRWVTRRADG